MALGIYLNSSSFNGKGGEHFELRLTYSLGEYNQASNTRNITKYLYFIAKDNYSAGGSKFTGYIDGVAVGTGTSLGKNQELLVGQKTDPIEYNNDGTKSISYSALIDTPWTLGDASVSDTLQLPQVNRISTFNFSNYQMIDIEDTLSILINKYVNSYTNKLIVLSSDRNTVYRTVDNVLNGYELTFTEEELNKIYASSSNTNNAYFVLKLETYDGNTKIGQVETGYYGYVTSANPTVVVAIEETDSKISEFLNSTSAVNIIKGLSKPKITVTPTLKKNATLKSILVTCNDGQSITKTSAPYEFSFNNVVGAKFDITVTDSRNNFVKYQINSSLLDYLPVKILSFNFERESSVSNNFTLNAEVEAFSGSINGQANTVSMMWRVNSGEWTNIASGFTFENNKITISDLELTNALSYSQSGIFDFYVKDLLSEDKDAKPVSPGTPTVDIGKSDFQVNGSLFVADILAQNKKNVMNEIYKRTECITASILAKQDISSNYIVNLNTVLNNNTDSKLTLVNGKIKIGAGVEIVEVTGNLMVDNITGSGGYVWGRIAKFKETDAGVEWVDTISSSISFMTNVSLAHLSTPCPSRILNVQEGDLIGFVADKSGFNDVVPYLRALKDATWLQVRILK